MLLESRWGAHAARRGPVVARACAAKLAEQLPAPQQADAKQAIERLLARAWSIEGAIPDLIDTGVEQGVPAEQLVDAILERAEGIKTDASEAVAQLCRVAASLTV